MKKFATESFDVLSVPGARPKDLWDFIPPHNMYRKIILFIGGNSQENFVSKSGAFRSAQEPVQVAIEIFEIALALTSRSEQVFIVGVPLRRTIKLQSNVLQLNTELNLLCRQVLSKTVFVGVSHYLYDLKHISKDLCHFENEAFAKIHKLLNEKVLKKKFTKSHHNKIRPIRKEISSYPF